MERLNAQHMKTVLRRKTDVKDSEWIADLLRHGLLKASFIPPQPIRALRDVTRYRKSLIQQRTLETNRLQKVLEGANIKLAAVATNVLGKSGRDMLDALIGGTTNAAVLADLARGLLCKKLPQLQQEIETLLAPFHEVMTLLQTIPDVHAMTAATIVAEIGVDMQHFPSAKHLASWAGVCPSNRQSAGKRFRATPICGRRSQRLPGLSPYQTNLSFCPVSSLRTPYGKEKSGGRCFLYLARYHLSHPLKKQSYAE